MYPLPTLSNEWRYHRRQSKQNSGPSDALDADKTNGQTYSLDNATTMPEFVDLVSARILIFRLLAYPPTKAKKTVFSTATRANLSAKLKAYWGAAKKNPARSNL